MQRDDDLAPLRELFLVARGSELHFFMWISPCLLLTFGFVSYVLYFCFKHNNYFPSVSNACGLYCSHCFSSCGETKSLQVCIHAMHWHCRCNTLQQWRQIISKKKKKKTMEANFQKCEGKGIHVRCITFGLITSGMTRGQPLPYNHGEKATMTCKFILFPAGFKAAWAVKLVHGRSKTIIFSMACA